jgi:hypothetical protein
MEKLAIDPQNISSWLIFSVVIGLIALGSAFYTYDQARTAMVETQMQMLILNKKIEEVRKLTQNAATATATVPSAPAAPAAQPAK